MTNLTFNGERPGSRVVYAVGCAVGVLLIGAGLWIMGNTEKPPGHSPWLLLGGIVVLVVASVKSKLNRAAQIELTPTGELLLSWRRRPVSVVRTGIVIGGWNDRLTGMPLGIYAEIDGLRIGGRNHEESGYQLNAPAEREVDIELQAPVFAELLQALGTTPMTAVGPDRGFVAVLGHSLGRAATLHVRPDELVLTKGENGPVVAGAPWPLVAVRCLVQLGEAEFDSGEYSRYPILELTIGARKPVRLGPGHTVRSSGAWPHNAQVTRHSPDYLLGETHWRMLRRTLKDKGLLFGSAT